MDELNLQASDFSAAVFHQPNTKFPQKVASKLGFQSYQIKTGLLCNDIGNTYAGSSPLGFTSLLDEADAGDRLLLASFGSGAGSDVFSFIVTRRIVDAKKRAPSTKMYINRTTPVDYATYIRWRKKIRSY